MFHVLPIRVYYEDTDFSGAVYHANYLKFCERGRSDCLRLLGIHHHELQGEANFVVRRMVCDFLKPATIDDACRSKPASWNWRGAHGTGPKGACAAAKRCLRPRSRWRWWMRKGGRSGIPPEIERRCLEPHAESWPVTQT